VSVSQFKRQLQVVRKHYRFISNQELLHALRTGEPLPELAVLVTFDDGFRNNLTHAVPVLKQLGIPAVFFVATGYIGANDVLWPHLLDELVLTWPYQTIPGPNGTMATLPTAPALKNRFAEQLRNTCLELADEDRRSYVEAIARDHSIQLDARLRELNTFLSWDEVRTLACQRFAIGSHTVNHPILTRLTGSRLHAELSESKATIEQEIGEACDCIAYPNGGAHDYSTSVTDAAHETGYLAGFTLCGRACDPHHTPLAIDRLCVVRSLTCHALEARMCGLAAMYHRMNWRA
jgi:peptidoglycan/xylan/chitin deacetylase (PgdA/CDA1 family)